MDTDSDLGVVLIIIIVVVIFVTYIILSWLIPALAAV